MTTLQERLFNLRVYNLKFEMGETDVTLRVDYPETWEPLTPANTDVKIFGDKDRPNRYYYKAAVTNDFGCILDEIDLVIKVNREAELKMTLFNNKIEELKQMFLDYSYQTLRLLELKLPLMASAEAPVKSKPRKKKKSTPASSGKVSEPVVDCGAAIPEEARGDTEAAEIEGVIIKQPLDGTSVADDIVNQYI